MSRPIPQDDALYIVGAGAQTPVGRFVLSAAAAVRCGITAYAEHPFMLDKYGEPMIVARAEWLPKRSSLEDRIATLAADAAKEALYPLERLSGGAPFRLIVRFALSSQTLSDVATRQRVVERLASWNRLFEISPVIDGHAGGLLALKNAVSELQSGAASLALVGGADSWLDPELLEQIDFRNWLHSINQSWGFTPGEGAGFCLLATGRSCRQLDLTPLAVLSSVACAEETNLMETQTVCVGRGLTSAFQAVLDQQQRVSHTYCDLNGEIYRADEFGMAICRTAECFEDASRFTAPADCWGDVGAASGPLGIALSIAGWQRNYPIGPVALVWSSSARMPLRAAATLMRWSESAA